MKNTILAGLVALSALPSQAATTEVVVGNESIEISITLKNSDMEAESMIEFMEGLPGVEDMKNAYIGPDERVLKLVSDHLVLHLSKRMGALKETSLSITLPKSASTQARNSAQIGKDGSASSFFQITQRSGGSLDRLLRLLLSSSGKGMTKYFANGHGDYNIANSIRANLGARLDCAPSFERIYVTCELSDNSF